MKDLGSYVHRLQKDAEREIRESGVFSKPIFPDWIDRSVNLKDNGGNRNAGY